LAPPTQVQVCRHALHATPAASLCPALASLLPPTRPQEELRKVEHALHHFSQLEMEMELTGP
jgi:hypothetical protein